MIQSDFYSKGITPVVATALLITISVAATASAYTFITETQQDVQESFREDLSQKECRSKSDLNIEYVYNNTNGFTSMNIRNTGSISMPVNESGRKILTLYADGKPVSSDAGSGGQGWKYQDDSVDLSTEDYLNPDELLTINTTIEFPSEGDRTAFKIVGSCEASDSHVCYNSGTASC